MYVGIDLGTSAVKLLLVTGDGAIVRTVSKTYDSLFPHPSWSEQDPNDWLNATVAGLRDLVLGHEADVQAMSFSGQMHGLVLLDGNDAVLRNAILWNDQRTKDQVDDLNEGIGMATLQELTGNIALTGLTAPKLLWVREREPALFARIRKIMLPKDYLVYKLCGAFASDVSDSSGTLYFDPRTKRYSEELLAILGIRKDQLPAICESFETVGTLQDPYRSILGLSSRVKIIAGGGDQAVGAIGAGIVKDGECSISLGTSGVVFVAGDHFVVDTKSHLQSYAHANGKYHVMGVMLNAAGAVRWWWEAVHGNHDYEAFYRDVTAAPASESLFFLPYLMGERAPINDPDAKGVFLGIQAHHGMKEFNRAVVEGVTFALRDSLELIRNLGITIRHVRITGGGAKSDVWAQMIADVMDVEVAKLAYEEGPAFGAAILAMVGSGVYPSVASACDRLVATDRIFVPNRAMSTLYHDKYLMFSRIYPQLKGLFKVI